MTSPAAASSPTLLMGRVPATAALDKLAEVAQSKRLVSSQKRSSDKGPVTSDDVGPATGVSPALLDGGPPTVAPPGLNNTAASGGLVYGAMGGASAWWTPIQASDDPSVATTSKSKEKEDNPASIEMVTMSSRPRLRKVDNKGKLVWPFELETVLIAGLRKYHATTCRPRPSASRNFNRNKLVSEYIESMTGVKRTTKQIASRIQVLRDAWKGKKEFTLVAQPRELIEMGYLPPLDDRTEPDLAGAIAQEEQQQTSQGPVRNVRRPRRSKDQPRGKAYDKDGVDRGFGSTRPSSQHESAHPSRRVRLSTLREEPGSPLISFDPYQLDRLGPPQASLENLIPSSTLFFVKNTLRRDKCLPTLLAKCMLSSAMSMAADTSAPPVRMCIDIDPASVLERIESFGETPAQRERLGTQVQLIQSSIVWDQETVLERDSGLARRITDPQTKERVSPTPSRSDLYRYVLDLQPAARQAIAAGRRHLIVVQTLSLCRVSDSRLLDSWMIIWIVQRSSQLTCMELIRLPAVIKGVSAMSGSKSLQSETPIENEDPYSSDSSLTPASSPIAPAAALSTFDQILPQDESPESFAPLVSPSPVEPPPSIEPYLMESEERVQEFTQINTPRLWPLTPVMTEAEEDSVPHIPALVELSGDMHMRDTFSLVSEPSQQSSPVTFAIAPQECSPPPPAAAQSYSMPPEMLPASSAVPSYAVAQRPVPRNHPTHIVVPREDSMAQDDSGGALYSHAPQLHHPASHLHSGEWHHAGHQHFIQHDAELQFDGPPPSAYHPVFVQNVESPQQPGSQFMYLEEMAQDSTSPPSSAASTSNSSHTHYYMAQSRPITAEHGWYSSAGTSAGGHQISHRYHRRHSEDSNWTTNSYIRHRSSFSPGPVVAPEIQLPQPPFHSVQYVYNPAPASSFELREAMAPDAYLSDDISGYHFHHTTPTLHSHLPDYPIPHSQMRHAIDSNVYGVYQY